MKLQLLQATENQAELEKSRGPDLSILTGICRLTYTSPKERQEGFESLKKRGAVELCLLPKNSQMPLCWVCVPGGATVVAPVGRCWKLPLCVLLSYNYLHKKG